MVSIGFAPALPRRARMPVETAGDRANTKTRTLARRMGRGASRGGVHRGRSVVLLQVHPGVERRDLIAVAVEHDGRPAEELADTALARLRPARVIDGRVHVRVEAV